LERNLLTMVNRLWNTTVGKVANTVMQLWLKTDTENRWSLYQVNNIPTAINGWNIVMILATSVYVDATGRRMDVVVANLVRPARVLFTYST
jgi:ACS family pantothenate transporter-like MFS transporter